MKKIYTVFLFILTFCFGVKAQTVLYSNTFSTSLGTATAYNGANGNWTWVNSCTQSSSGGHSAPGSALYQGSSCQFGNGSNTVSGDLKTPAIPITALGGTLSFNYFIANECGSGSCTYDVLSAQISNNGGISYTTVASSNSSPGGMANTTGWTSYSMNLSAYANQTIIVNFNFNSLDGIANAYDGIYVDDILVLGACSISLAATVGNQPVNPAICSGNSLTLTTNAISNYSWSNGATTSSIVISPSVNTTYSLSATSPSNCTASSAIVVTVSPGAPVLTVTSSTTNVCLGKTVTLTATGANSYSWTGGVTNGAGFTPTVSGTYVVTGMNGCGTTTSAITLTVAPLPVSLLITPTVVCAGSPALLNISAGSANVFTITPNTQVIGTSSTNLYPTSNTTYTIVASDGTCSGVSSISIATNPNPTISVAASATQVCQGDPVTLTASGGNTYTWTPITSNNASVVVTPTTSSSYSVGGSNSFNCSSGAIVVILTNPSPVITAVTSDPLICNGSSATLSASGASTYTWSSGPTAATTIESPVVNTVYTVTGTQNNCTGTQTVEVDVFTPSVTITGNTVICSGASSTLNAVGADSYTWLPGFTFPTNVVSPTSNTTYTLATETNTNNLICQATNTIAVNVNPTPTVTAAATRTAICRGETTTITANGASSYTWTNASQNTASIVVNGSLVTTLSYTVTGENSFNCSNSASLQIKVNACISVQEYEAAAKLSVYPNPNNGSFTISSDRNAHLSIYNQLGQIVKTISINGIGESKIEVSGLPKGVYFIRNTDVTEASSTKIMVE